MNQWNRPHELACKVRNLLIRKNGTFGQRFNQALGYGDIGLLLDLKLYPSESKAYKIVKEILKLMPPYDQWRQLDFHWTKQHKVRELLIDLFGQIERSYWEYFIKQAEN